MDALGNVTPHNTHTHVLCSCWISCTTKKADLINKDFKNIFYLISLACHHFFVKMAGYNQYIQMSIYIQYTVYILHLKCNVYVNIQYTGCFYSEQRALLQELSGPEVLKYSQTSLMIQHDNRNSQTGLCGVCTEDHSKCFKQSGDSYVESTHIEWIDVYIDHLLSGMNIVLCVYRLF